MIIRGGLSGIVERIPEIKGKVLPPPYPGILLLTLSSLKQSPLCVVTEDKEKLGEDLSGILKDVLSLSPKNTVEVAAAIERKKFSVLVLSPEDLEIPFPILKGREIKRGMYLEWEEFLKLLSDWGYERTEFVREKGEFAVRGCVVDVFPVGESVPVRVEFSEDEVVSLRNFDPVSQRSINKINSVVIHPRDPEKGKVTFGEVIKEFPWIGEGGNLIDLSPEGKIFRFEVAPYFERDFKNFKEHLKKLDGYTIYFLSSSPGEKERLKELLEDEFPGLIIEEGYLSRGFIIHDTRLAVFTEMDLFGRSLRKREKIEIKTEPLETLREGDLVVHEDYGIGVFEGMELLKVGDTETECAVVRYRENARIYVPVYFMHRLSKYIGKEDIEISSLAKGVWERKKRRIKESVKEIARELLELYTKRKKSRGFACSPDTLWQREMEALFPYEETEDQLRAIEEIKQDLEAPYPMDRLLCGEVGYGKTEVALRAAFKVVMDGKQVAILTPTTLLAEQHYFTFRERLERFPVRVELLSRFTKNREKEILKDLEEGRIDIIIGTHRLLSDDVKFRDLGLVIIDEEHRFGVLQKEKLKKLRINVDVLSMSATPIPRTLKLSLSGFLDFSLIETPPPGRKAVETEIIHWNDGVIREVILREVERGGQVFFIHNRIETIEGVRKKLERIVPEVSIGVAHGRMRSKELERVMRNFIEKRYDVLLSTAIIEAGIDIPNANTIIINNAHRFGLAELHQLRGRVGRSPRKAFCYLIVPERITEEARKRVFAIKQYSHLGAGFKIAKLDLEMRGAGNILGKEQHGHMHEVGYELYMKLVEEAVRELKGEEVKREDVELRVREKLLIPESYIPSFEERMVVYKRLSGVRDEEEIEEIFEEIKDRFGEPPAEVRVLFEWMRIKSLGTRAGVERIEERRDEYVVMLETMPRQTLEKVIKEVDGLRFSWKGKLEISMPKDKEKLIKLLKILSQYDNVLKKGG